MRPPDLLVMRPEEYRATLGNRLWRIDNIYSVINEHGRHVPFRLKYEQRNLLANLHTKNILLKARQLGFSTLIDLLILDACLFNSNLRCGIIADTLPNARQLLKNKVIFPFVNLHPSLAAQLPKMDVCNAESVTFSNGSSIEVGVSLRGGTMQWLHVSELGKVAAKHPEKAREIRTGALNTVAPDCMVLVESTAEGSEGVFYEMVQNAMAAMALPLTKMDYRFHFFPWWGEPKYQLDQPVHIDDELHAYFDKLRAEGLPLTDAQKAWYAKKLKEQGPDMKREYPTFPMEAFESTRDGAYYSKQMAKAMAENRVGRFPADPNAPVYTVWDIGHSDSTSIGFVQFIGPWIRCVDFIENSGEQVKWYTDKIKEKALENGYRMARDTRGRMICFMPHDIRAEVWGMERTRVEQLVEHGFAPEIVPDVSVADGIEAVRVLLDYFLFNAEPCERWLSCLRNYRKEWNERTGMWKSSPFHNWASHGADMTRYLAVAYNASYGRREEAAAPEPLKGIEAETVEQLMFKKGKGRGTYKRI